MCDDWVVQRLCRPRANLCASNGTSIGYIHTSGSPRFLPANHGFITSSTRPRFLFGSQYSQKSRLIHSNSFCSGRHPVDDFLLSSKMSMLLLSLFLLRSRLTSAAPLQNYTSMSNATAPIWVDPPTGRGTWSILGSCLSTLFLCVWKSLHLNVPAMNESDWTNTCGR